MKKKIYIFIFCVLLFLSACSFEDGDASKPQDSIKKYGTLASSIFIDPYTGVNYITRNGGICPRYNPDGSLYVTEVKPQK